MKDYSQLNADELQAERKRVQELLQDAEDERRFLGMQSGQHIKVAEFNRIDQDIEKYTSWIKAIDERLAT